MNPTPKQINVINETEQLVKKPLRPTFVAVASAPGSGKTYTVVKSLIAAAKWVKPGDKILVLAFNSKAKDDILKKIESSDVNPELFDIRTVHSLFFQQSKKFEFGSDSFSLDYTKGIFTDDMVRTAMATMCIGEKPIDPTVEDLLAPGRIFTPEILSKNNIRVLTFFVNAYFSTAAKISQTEALTKSASFYAKCDIDLNALSLSPDDRAKISIGREALPEKTRNKSDAELLLSLLLHKISVLAKITTPKEYEAISVQVDFLNPSGKVIGHSNFERNKVKKDSAYAHIFKVPHNYYYKSFYSKAMKDPTFLADTFGGYCAVVVDEAQDNDRMFFDVLRKAMESNVLPVCVAVGDSDQSIYAFKSPDHFDILRAAPALAAKNTIEVKQFALDESFRFGKGISSFVAEVFDGTSIIGAGEIHGAVYPNAIDIDDLAKFLRGSEGHKTAIVCRTNAEATSIALELKKNPGGSGLLKLHKSLKEDLRKQYGGGPDAGVDEPIEEVHSNKKFDSAEIRRHLLSSERISSTNVIMSAHQSKGDEFDYVILAGDFFRNDNSDEPSLMSALSFMEQQDETKTKELLAQLQNTDRLEERNTLYVALTRAKKGMLIMRSTLADALLPIARKHATDQNVIDEMHSMFLNENDPAPKKNKGFKETFPDLFSRTDANTPNAERIRP